MDVSRILRCEQARQMACKICAHRMKGADPRAIRHNLDKLIPDIGSDYLTLLQEICNICDNLMDTRAKVNDELCKEAKAKTKKCV